MPPSHEKRPQMQSKTPDTVRKMLLLDDLKKKNLTLRSASNIKECVSVQRDELTPDDFIIAVMGPTGAGKSTLISCATRINAGVGSSLQSFTSRITAFRISFDDGINVVLVDTPGFDDTHLSDLDILKLVSDWLRAKRKKRLYLAGMLYLHRISDNRMGGTPLKNLKMFQKLCGKDRYDKVILTTTMWSTVGNEGNLREDDLKNHYWDSMIERGSGVYRFEDSFQSAWEIIDQFLGGSKQLIKIQRELNADWKGVPDTTAGKELYGMVGALARRQQEVLRQLQSEVLQVRDEQALKALLQEYTELGERREKLMHEMRELKSSFFGRLCRFATRKQTPFPYQDRCEALALGLLDKDDLNTRIDRLMSGEVGLLAMFLNQLESEKRVPHAEGPKFHSLLEYSKKRAECFTKDDRGHSPKPSNPQNDKPNVEIDYEEVYGIILSLLRVDTSS